MDFDGEDRTQNYLVFQPIHKYFKTMRDQKTKAQTKIKIRKTMR